ncbi:GNAT family N-acetyltransferase [Bosea lathyri]|uniref:Acetyltransferase involved in cellulose biosynthesis, CelD/BcsL family n=1 Tax=Bosea lathyri TaxID=1036778 RepID=A0A1H5X2Z6_9HYPH|nr:GNAT family N-acetyltransferase [Bosea lathyri]SEG05923.1 Acetyltransferase involved in cellulose biosynthesis, CelD/BcsL family [Bosea lathyri]
MNAGIVVRRARPADYVALGPAFAELARHALEPNPHMAPAAVAAAMLLVPEAEIVILTAWLSEALGSERLIGVWVLRRQRDWRSGFAAVLVSPLLPLYEVSSIPVLDRDHADDVAQAMLRYLLASGDLPKTLALPLLPIEGAGFTTLAEACRVTASRLRTYETWARPVMLAQPGDDTERYLRRALGSSYKKRMQQFRAIARNGAVTLRRRRGDAARDALETFLNLEAAGWKGKEGTAIACLPADAAYFRELVMRFAREDALQVDALLLDEQPIAMGLLIESAGTRHFLKIAYDETQSRYSPGRALTVAMIQADFAGTPATFFDSGAGDGVDAGTYVWGERRTMANAIIGLGSARPGPAQMAARARQWLRRLRDRRKG